MICFSYNYNYVTEHSAKNPFKKETVSQPKRQGFGRSGIGQGWRVCSEQSAYRTNRNSLSR